MTAWRLVRIGLFLLLVVAAAVALTYCTIPTERGDPKRPDVIVVLGSPAQPDGTPSYEERERVLEGVREMRRNGTAFLLLTGGAAHGPWVESDVMAQVALGAGVPPASILREREARNTLQNIFYAARLMQTRGWSSAEFVSSPSHTPRIGLILEHYSFAWKTHKAPWPPEYSRRLIASHLAYEVAGTTLLRWFGFRRTPYLPHRSSLAQAFHPPGQVRRRCATDGSRMSFASDPRAVAARVSSKSHPAHAGGATALNRSFRPL